MLHAFSLQLDSVVTAECMQVLARNPRAAATIVQEGALPALAMTAGEGLSERAKINANKVLSMLYLPMCRYAHWHFAVLSTSCLHALLHFTLFLAAVGKFLCSLHHRLIDLDDSTMFSTYHS